MNFTKLKVAYRFYLMKRIILDYILSCQWFSLVMNKINYWLTLYNKYLYFHSLNIWNIKKIIRCIWYSYMYITYYKYISYDSTFANMGLQGYYGHWVWDKYVTWLKNTRSFLFRRQKLVFCTIYKLRYVFRVFEQVRERVTYFHRIFLLRTCYLDALNIAFK